MTLYPHQHHFLHEVDNDNALLCYETGTGKSFCAVRWLQQKDRARNAVVICPKQIRDRWKKDASFASVYSFEDFKKMPLPDDPSAIVIDEIDGMASPLHIPKLRSQRTEKAYEYIMTWENAHVLGLTATPVRSSPANMHTLLVLCRLIPAGRATWKKYQERYYSLQYKPYLPRPAWLPIDTWRKDMQALINKYTHTAVMSDIVDLPPETHTVVSLKPPAYDKNPEWEPMAEFVYNHRAEQTSKTAEVLRIGRGYRKVVIVAHYTEQIDVLYKALSKDRACYVLDGRTKKQEEVIQQAEYDPECYFIIQASVVAGFELPSFSVTIFASMGYSVRNYVQMCGRTKRINALKPVLYVYLLGGKCDKAIYTLVKQGLDFIPSHYLQHGETTTQD